MSMSYIVYLLALFSCLIAIDNMLIRICLNECIEFVVDRKMRNIMFLLQLLEKHDI